MSNTKSNAFYKNIIGDTNETIQAIQKFLEKNQPKPSVSQSNSAPIDSINRVIKSVLNDDVATEIQKIINDL